MLAERRQWNSHGEQHEGRHAPRRVRKQRRVQHHVAHCKKSHMDQHRDSTNIGRSPRPRSDFRCGAKQGSASATGIRAEGSNAAGAAHKTETAPEVSGGEHQKGAMFEGAAHRGAAAAWIRSRTRSARSTPTPASTCTANGPINQALQATPRDPRAREEGQTAGSKRRRTRSDIAHARGRQKRDNPGNVTSATATSTRVTDQRVDPEAISLRRDRMNSARPTATHTQQSQDARMPDWNCKRQATRRTTILSLTLLHAVTHAIKRRVKAE